MARNAVVTALALAGAIQAAGPIQAPEAVVPNDNRVPGGRMVGDTLVLHLETRTAAWRPDLAIDTSVTVQTFAEAEGPPRIPAPLLRAPAGTPIRVTIRNTFADSTLVVHGMRAGTVANDTIHIAPGATRRLNFKAALPGTYMYWGTTSGQSAPATRPGRDSQLTGAIVIDPTDAPMDPDERIFVMTVLDIVPDSAKGISEDLFDLAINGLSWPYSERLQYDVGDTARWRWVNGSYLPHPMHLHGFHFRVLSKGNGTRDSLYAPTEIRHAVTEFMVAGSTFTMDWIPTRAGNWLMHCHMTPHITPFPSRPDSVQPHDEHDARAHAATGMSGLVLGITTTDRRQSLATPVAAPAIQYRMAVLQSPPDSAGRRSYGYALGSGDARLDSIRVPGPPLVLTRGETAMITVVNRTDQPTTVHWHGMELESIYDGVAGWSGSTTSVAPLIARGDSFAAVFTPPRAGTFIYHTHMDESAQLRRGLYGPLLVMEPGKRYDPATDLVFIAGGALEAGEEKPTINGRSSPNALRLHAGTAYRIRFINIMPAEAVMLRLQSASDSVPVVWRPLAKDGADLPPALQRTAPAMIGRIGVGETYDFEWTPTRLESVDLVLVLPRSGLSLHQRILVE